MKKLFVAQGLVFMIIVVLGFFSLVQAGGYVNVEPGVDIYYEEKGEGPPLVIVPGWTCTSAMFKAQLDYFSKTHRVVIIDPRSQGRSTKTPHGNDFITHSADLAKVIKTLDLRDVSLVGWSFGCTETYGYVKQEGVDNLKCHVCIDMPPKALSSDPNEWTEGKIEDIASMYHGLLSPKGQRDMVAFFADNFWVERKLTPEEINWVVDELTQTPPLAAAQLMASGMYSNYLEEAKLLDKSVPTLNILAKHWAEKAEVYLKEHCPNSKTAVLGAHMMFWEYPEEFNKILEEFLNSIK